MLLFQTQLLLDRVNQPGAKIFVVHRQDGRVAVEKNLQVRTVRRPKGRSLFLQPALELFARHPPIIRSFVYKDEPRWNNLRRNNA